MGVLALGGNDGIDTDFALPAADCIDAAVNLVERISEGVRDLAKRDQPDCFLVSNPFQGHSGYICS